LSVLFYKSSGSLGVLVRRSPRLVPTEARRQDDPALRLQGLSENVFVPDAEARLAPAKASNKSGAGFSFVLQFFATSRS
jgi:hypothetical protein